MTGDKYIKVHCRGSEQLESRGLGVGSQTMGLVPMVMVKSLVIQLYVYFLFLCWFDKYGIPHKKFCVVSV
jgi:hypothetical protein